MTDPAADPLADVRAHHDDCDAEWCATHGRPYATCSHGCEVFVLLAALDAERAETARLGQWGEDPARNAMRNRGLHDKACEEVERLGDAVWDQRERAERAEAAIARARAVRPPRLRLIEGEQFVAGYRAALLAVAAALGDGDTG